MGGGPVPVRPASFFHQLGRSVNSTVVKDHFDDAVVTRGRGRSVNKMGGWLRSAGVCPTRSSGRLRLEGRLGGIPNSSVIKLTTKHPGTRIGRFHRWIQRLAIDVFQHLPSCCSVLLQLLRLFVDIRVEPVFGKGRNERVRNGHAGSIA